MLEFFYEKKDYFQLKELERLCSKEKGITSMSVKDVLMDLVNDGLVDTDKIGTCVYFWAFPSKASQNRKRKVSSLDENLADVKRKKVEFASKIASLRVGREQSEARDNILRELMEKRGELEAIEADLKKYRDCDPDYIETLKSEAKMCAEGANRWTDNIFIIKSWITKKFNMDSAVIDKQFGIPEDLDYLPIDV